MYAQVTNGEITRINISLPYSTETVSIPAGATDLEQFDLYPMVGDEPFYDPTTQRLSGPTYAFIGNAVERVYTVEDISQEELTEKLTNSVIEATQNRLDNFAKTRNYDGILSLCSYATDPDPKFAQEGQRAVVLRSSTWAKLYEILREIEMGARAMPESYSDIEPELPELTWLT